MQSSSNRDTLSPCTFPEPNTATSCVQVAGEKGLLEPLLTGHQVLLHFLQKPHIGSVCNKWERNTAIKDQMQVFRDLQVPRTAELNLW